jgi:hypothetical protein
MKETNATDSEKKEAIEAKKEKQAPFLFRSTGLGNMTLEGEPFDLTVSGDCIVLHIQTTSPVSWHVRAAMTFGGILSLFKFAFKFSVIKFATLGLFTMFKPRIPDEF